MMEKEAITNLVTDDLDARNRNWDKIDENFTIINTKLTPVNYYNDLVVHASWLTPLTSNIQQVILYGDMVVINLSYDVITETPGGGNIEVISIPSVIKPEKNTVGTATTTVGGVTTPFLAYIRAASEHIVFRKSDNFVNNSEINLRFMYFK